MRSVRPAISIPSTYAYCLGYIVQTIVNNLAPLLFFALSAGFGLALEQIALLSTVNFAVQLCVDLLSARVINRVGSRVRVMAAHVFAAAGLAGLTVFPALYAVGGGVIVLVSLIVESYPTEKRRR